MRRTSPLLARAIEALVSSEADPYVDRMVQFVHPDRALGFLPTADEAACAALFGLSLDRFRAIRERFEQQARLAAEELMEDPAFAARVWRLPFRPAERILAIGESSTADRQSWFEILRHLVASARPRDEIVFVNHAVEGTTSTQALARLRLMLMSEPTWIFCCLGGADSVRVGLDAAKTLVSLEETDRNLDEIRRVSGVRVTVSWTWLTPPTVNEQIEDAFPPFRRFEMSLRNADLLAVGELVRQRSDPVVDVQGVFGRSAPAALVQFDGIHPSLAGQATIARAVVEELTS